MKEEQEDVDSKTIRGYEIAVVAIPSPLHRTRRQPHSEIDKIPSLQAAFYWSPFRSLVAKLRLPPNLSYTQYNKTLFPKCFKRFKLIHISFCRCSLKYFFNLCIYLQK